MSVSYLVLYLFHTLESANSSCDVFLWFDCHVTVYGRSTTPPPPPQTPRQQIDEHMDYELYATVEDIMH